MSKVYLICSDVDLGYHVECAFYNKESADNKVNSMNNDYATDKIKDLIEHCKYTSEAAELWMKQHGDEYFVEILEVT